MAVRTKDEIVENEGVKAAEATEEAPPETRAQVNEVDTPEVDESLNPHIPLKTYYVYDRDTVLEAEVLGEGDQQGLNLRVSGVASQKFSTSVSTGATAQDFLNVRKGTGRHDVGSYFEA